MNSVVDIKLDTWGGTHAAREKSLAAAMQEGGMTHTFRCAHPETRAFTYFHATSSASRLDQVWYWAPATAEVLVCNTAIVWGWARKADHEPAVADLCLSIPEDVLEAAPAPSQWRNIVRLMEYDKGQ